jgi:hypothetical protein
MMLSGSGIPQDKQIKGIHEFKHLVHHILFSFKKVDFILASTRVLHSSNALLPFSFLLNLESWQMAN